MTGCISCNYRALAAGLLVGYAALHFKVSPVWALIIGLGVAFLLSPYQKEEVDRGVGNNY